MVARHQRKIQSDEREHRLLESLRSDYLWQRVKDLVAWELSGLHWRKRAQHTMPGVPSGGQWWRHHEWKFPGSFSYRSCSSVRNAVPSSFFVCSVKAETNDDVIVSHHRRQFFMVLLCDDDVILLATFPLLSFPCSFDVVIRHHVPTAATKRFSAKNVPKRMNTAKKSTSTACALWRGCHFSCVWSIAVFQKRREQN